MVTNLAARMGAFAKEESVVVSAETARRISDQFVMENLGQLQFKNVSEPMQAFCLLEKNIENTRHYAGQAYVTFFVENSSLTELYF